jgi:hypothetical protein
MALNPNDRDCDLFGNVGRSILELIWKKTWNKNGIHRGMRLE